MKSRLAWVVFVVGIVSLIGSVYFWDQARRRTIYSNYTLRVEYQALPPDDHEVLDWLTKQPGYQKAEVSRAGNKINFDLTFDPPEPDLLGKLLKHCEENGYAGRLGFVGGFGPYR